MSYPNTFIQVADDCPVDVNVVSVPKGKSNPIHVIQYELLSQQPYHYGHQDLIFAVHIRRQVIPSAEVQVRKPELWADLFQKEHPCLRASALTKKYGWGAHYDEAGKIALYGLESDEYHHFSQPRLKQLKAFRNKRA